MATSLLTSNLEGNFVKVSLQDGGEYALANIENELTQCNVTFLPIIPKGGGSFEVSLQISENEWELKVLKLVALGWNDRRAGNKK